MSKLIFSFIASFICCVLGHSSAMAQSGTGTCTGCTTYTYLNAAGDPCQNIVCTDAGFPGCLTASPANTTKVCNAGESFYTNSCTTDRMLECRYECNAARTGWEEKSCVSSSQSSVSGGYCDWSSCGGVNSSGVLMGKLVQWGVTCKDGTSGTSNNIGVCGEGGFARIVRDAVGRGEAIFDERARPSSAGYARRARREAIHRSRRKRPSDHQKIMTGHRRKLDRQRPARASGHRPGADRDRRERPIEPH